jgi:hypothetical protein
MTTFSSLPFKEVDASTGTQSLLATSDHSTMSPPTKPLDRERERERKKMEVSEGLRGSKNDHRVMLRMRNDGF